MNGMRRGKGARHDRPGQRRPPGRGRWTVTSPHRHPTSVGSRTSPTADLGRFVYVAFVVDVFAQRIVGWHVASTKVTDVVLTPPRIALWDRDRQRDPGRAGSAAAPLR
jgi:transposase InsO family protein